MLGFGGLYLLPREMLLDEVRPIFKLSKLPLDVRPTFGLDTVVDVLCFLLDVL